MCSHSSAATAATSTVRAEAVIIMIRRGDTRSVTAPPSSIKPARGIAPTMLIVPSAMLDPVSPSTSHGSATK